MTRSDRWKKRPCVSRYFDFKDKVKELGIEVPDAGSEIIFQIQMPKSWSAKKKKEMVLTPHKQKPDLDNLVKALFDALYSDDSVVWSFKATKIWGYVGSIIIGF